MKVALFATHPIQYQVPWFRALHGCGELDLTVHYARIPDPVSQGVGFGVAFEWDIPLLDGYRWTVATAARRSTVRDALKEADLAIVTGWQESFLRWAALAARRRSMPVLVRGESSALRPRRWTTGLVHRVYLRFFNCFLVIGHANDRFYDQYGVPASKRVRCPYFVDNERFVAEATRLSGQRAALRSRWGIPADSFCFLFAGKLVEKKRPLDVIKALMRARHQSGSLHLLVVGDGILRRAVEELASQAGLSVTFAGFLNQTEMPQAYVAADALVLPSDYGETWGLVVNEAMACGRPAVTSDRVGCAPDLIIDGETGFQFPFGDVKVLADRMRCLADDPKGAGVMGGEARRRVLSRYAVEQAVQGTIKAVRIVTAP